MTTRKPIVLTDNGLSELPIGDDIGVGDSVQAALDQKMNTVDGVDINAAIAVAIFLST